MQDHSVTSQIQSPISTVNDRRLNGNKLLLVELNEFDPEFLQKQAERLNLKSLSKFLSMVQSSTITEDEIEHQGLDPWVQWVNVHTGRSSDYHGIKRLGDTLKQRDSEIQLWEAVGAAGGSWAAWGVMNAPMGNQKGCELFMPDPWSFEEDAYPKRLNDLLALPRYMARNYTDIKKSEIIKNFTLFLKSYALPKHWPVLAKFTKVFLLNSKDHGVSLHTLTTLLDYLGALEFSRAKRRSDLQFSVIFLNHIAHLQHQFWVKGDELHNEMELGLKVSDLIMELLLDSRQENEAIILMNGLRQKNVAGEGFYVYRQINPLKAMDILLGGSEQKWSDWSVEQLMTNDAHLHMSTKLDADRAEALLQNTKLSTGEEVFFTERLSPTDVFCQLNVEHSIEKDTMVSNSVITFNFYDVFELVCERTGAHLQVGDVFSDNINLPDHFHNHEVYNHILSYLLSPSNQP
jgi:hypothetical protein